MSKVTIKPKTKQNRRLISSRSIGVRPFLDDLREMSRLCDPPGKETVTELARTLIHEALRTRRLRAVSDGEGASDVQNPGRQFFTDALNPLRENLSEVRRIVSEFQSNAVLLDVIQKMQNSLAGWQEQQGQEGRVMQALYTLIVQALGYSMMTERETRLLLEGELAAQRKTPEQVKSLLANLEEKSHEETDQAVFKILREHHLAE
ncbi:MAG: hypothetical protein ABI977_33200 [Acidobacteriota bacterium]